MATTHKEFELSGYVKRVNLVKKKKKKEAMFKSDMIVSEFTPDRSVVPLELEISTKNQQESISGGQLQSGNEEKKTINL